MSDIVITDYKPEHLVGFNLMDCHLSEEIKEVNTEAVTFLSKGKPIAIIGWFLIAPGVLQVWSILSKESCNHKFSFLKSVVHLIRYGFDRFSLRRMQMSVKVGYDRGWKMAKFLGFKCEGIMHSY